MAKASQMVSLQTQSHHLYPAAKTQAGIHSQIFSFKTPTKILLSASRKRRSPLQITRKASKAPRRVITISSPSGAWPGKWTYDYIVSLKELQLEDLAEDGRKGTPVYISLCLHKHTGVGLSVDGRIVTTIARKCSNCFSPYNNEVDTNFNVWVLPSSKDDPSIELPELGGDPSVIYVKPGYEANLDSLVQDIIRLQISIKETCSEPCEKAQPKLHYSGVQRTAPLDRWWSRLLELRRQVS